MRAGQLPKPSGDLRSDAIGELRWAMAGVGLTVDKVPLMQAVLKLPTVSHALNGVSPPARPRVALDALVAAARALGDGLQARMLRNSLAVDYHGDGKDLTERRLAFVRDHNDAVRAAGGRNYLGESARALYDVEQEMLAAMVTGLGAPDACMPGTAVAEAPAAWATVDYDITYRLRGRSGVEAEVVHVARALVVGVDEMTVGYYCGTDDGGAAQLQVLEGGTLIDDRTVGRPGFRSARIRYPHVLDVGGTHRIRYDVHYPGTSPKPDQYFTLQVIRPTDHLTVRVSFDRSELPGRAWRIDGLSAEEQGGNPEICEALEIDPTGCAVASFESPSGFCYGIGWEWAGDDGNVAAPDDSGQSPAPDR